MKKQTILLRALIIVINLALLSQSLLFYSADASARPRSLKSSLNRSALHASRGDARLPDPVLSVAMSTIERGLNGVPDDQKTRFDRIFDGLLEKYPQISRKDLWKVVSTWKQLPTDAKAAMSWQRLLAISLGPQQERQRPIIPPQRRVPPPNQQSRPESDEVRSRVRPLTIRAGSVMRVPVINTMSPYFGAQVKKNLGDLTQTLIEADYWNNAYRYFGFGSENKGPAPQGVDQLAVVIDKAQQDFKINFRYSTGEKNVTGGLWQISRFPFPNDPTHWESVPGLVASGQVIDESVQADGFHYFRINFARVAAQIPGSKPYYEGTVSPKRSGTEVPAVRVNPPQPSTPVRRLPELMRRPPVPQTPPVSRRGGTIGREVAQAQFARSRYLTTDTDQIFYVRVIPMHAGNKGGMPAIPVEITVNRPRPCPKVSGDQIVRPPSAQILWYMRPNFFNNAGSGRWYVIHGAGTPNGNPFLPQHMHMKDPPLQPEEQAWYEKVIDAFGDIVDFFSDMMTAFSVALDMLENVVVSLTAQGLSFLTAGLYRCDEHKECTDVLKAGLQSVMLAYGIPPTLPTGPELFNLSTDYLIKLGAEQIGAGELLAMYNALPDNVKDEMKSKGNDISGSLVQAQSNAQEDSLRKTTCFDIPDPMNQSSTRTYCAPRIPDPIFNAIHPATVMVFVENQNNEPTDSMKLTVTDSMGLYRRGTAIVPSLQPGESIPIPVTLAEDTQQFLKVNGGKCPNPEDSVTIQGEPPCPVLQWRDRFWQLGSYYKTNKEADNFRATFSMKLGMSEITGLDDQSSGRSLQTLISLDAQAAGGACSVPGTLRYPQGWKITTRSRSVVPEVWDRLFTGGEGGNPSNGMLRNKP